MRTVVVGPRLVIALLVILHGAGVPGHIQCEDLSGSGADHDADGDLPPAGVDEGFQVVHQDVGGADLGQGVLVGAPGFLSQVSELALDRGRGAAQDPGHAAHGHPRNRQFKDTTIEFRAVLPGAAVTGWGAPGRAAGAALEACDVAALGDSVAVLPGKARRGRPMVDARRIGATDPGHGG